MYLHRIYITSGARGLRYIKTKTCNQETGFEFFANIYLFITQPFSFRNLLFTQKVMNLM